MVNLPQSNDITIFDRTRIRSNRQRIQTRFIEHDFLFRHGQKELLNRLADIKRTFPHALHLGSRCAPDMPHDKIGNLFISDLSIPREQHNTPFFLAHEDFLPIKPASLDLVLSNLTLHTVNDLPGALLQIRQSLKPDGLFIASMFGGETLHELRDVLTQTEINMLGGLSPRVFPFADKPQMGGLLQRAGFSLPVVDSEIVHVTYDHMFKLMHDLRYMGEGNAVAARNKMPLPRSFFMEAAKLYHEKYAQTNGRIPASFEIIYLIGWSPHESQQKPLRPGSAKTSLADYLGTSEITTGDKAAP